MTATGTGAVRRPPAPALRGGPEPAMRRWLGGASAALGTTGALHLAAATQWVTAGERAVAFFLLVAAAQLGLAVWLAAHAWLRLRPPPKLLALSIAGTLCLLAAYLLAETTDLLDAFTVAGPPSAEHHHRKGEALAVDPVTGLDYSDGAASRFEGPVPLAGAIRAAEAGTGALAPATAAAEFLALVALTALLPGSWRGRAVNAVVVLGGLAWLLWFAGVLR